MSKHNIVRTIELVVYTAVIVFVIAVCAAGTWQHATTATNHHNVVLRK